jgi:uncharacterized protein (DUF952 family)
LASPDGDIPKRDASASRAFQMRECVNGPPSSGGSAGRAKRDIAASDRFPIGYRPVADEPASASPSRARSTFFVHIESARNDCGVPDGSVGILFRRAEIFAKRTRLCAPAGFYLLQFYQCLEIFPPYWATSCNLLAIFRARSACDRSAGWLGCPRSAEASVRLIYKIASEGLWSAACARGVFAGAPVDLADGYIHFSTAEQTSETAAKHFARQSGLLLIAVDADALGPALNWEPSRGGALFPHLYRSLSTKEALWAKPIPMDAAGEHRFDGLL